jgi:hypothetical protein
MLQVLQEGPAMCLLPRAWGQRRCSQGRGLGLRHSLGPVRLQQGGVVDNGRKQGREGPEEQSWEELANDWVLEDKVHGRRVTGALDSGKGLVIPQTQCWAAYREGSPQVLVG